MNGLESLLRETLHDDRRRVEGPADVTAWVAAGVSRQRRRLATATAVVTVVVLALGSAVVLPIVLRDDPATYVAGAPEEETGLLAWEPVGSLIEDSEAIEGALQAWSDDAPAGQQPDGDVYVLMVGAEVGDGGGAYLQGRSTDGDAMLAFLTRADDLADWKLVETTQISDPSSTEFVVVPPVEDVEGSLLAVLAPKWRDTPARWLSKPIGWAEVPSETRFGETQWRQVFRAYPNDWLTALGVPLEGDVAHRVLLGRGNGVAHLVEAPTSGETTYVGADTGTVVRSLDGTPPGPEVLQPGAVLADSLRIGPEVSMTLIGMAQRSAVVGPLNARSERVIRMSVILFEPEDGRRVVGAVVQKPSGRAICGTRKYVPADILGRYVAAAVCPVPLSTGERSLWLVGRWNVGEDFNPNLDLTLDVERADGTVTTASVTQRRNETLDEWVESSNLSPYSRFVLRGLDPFEGTPFDPWEWPAQWLGVR